MLPAPRSYHSVVRIAGYSGPPLAHYSAHDGRTIILLYMPPSSPSNTLTWLVFSLTVTTAIINTLPSGHAEMRDYCPMRCWRVTHFCVFYATSCTCVCHLVWLNYRIKVIASLMQNAWVSSYKQTDRSWPPIFRTIRLQQTHHSFRYSFCFPSVAIMALCRNVLQEDNILCELYSDTRSDVSKVRTVTVTSPLVHVNSCNLLS